MNKQRDDLTGKTFGRWTVLYFLYTTEHRDAYWMCRCECGSEHKVRSNQLKNGTNRSCGCLQRELTAEKNWKHGLSNHPMKQTYYAMLARCYNTTSTEYHNYGARGIFVCDRWRNSFPDFFNDMGERPNGCTIDRIDNNGPYSPENCRWATWRQQRTNTRINHILEYDGKAQTIIEWADEIGISPNTIHSRLHRGWSVHDTITRPVDIRSRHLK